jgi:Asp-tRNA(Asn)/Glu-tRNA(Gln) amidotransferase A subunit family amidase
MIDNWEYGAKLADLITEAEAARTWRSLLDYPHLLGPDVRALLEQSLDITDTELDDWHNDARKISKAITQLLPPATVLALPTLTDQPPLITEAANCNIGELCGIVNLAKLCALSMPIPAKNGLIASLQLIGPANSESLLLATANCITTKLPLT